MAMLLCVVQAAQAAADAEEAALIARDLAPYEKVAVLVSECATLRGKEILLLPVGGGFGTLLEIWDQRLASSATVRADKDGIGLDETNGGIGNYQRVGKVIEELSRYGFRYVPPGTLHFDVEARPTKRCQDSGRSKVEEEKERVK